MTVKLAIVKASKNQNGFFVSEASRKGLSAINGKSRAAFTEALKQRLFGEDKTLESISIEFAPDDIVLETRQPS